MSAPSSRYDYIIAGAGAAGLSLLVRMIASGKFADKKILLAEKAPKTSNDRTWCFWEEGAGYFEQLVCCKWNHIWYHGPGFSHQFDILPYHYKMIRGIDFYEHCFPIISSQPNVTIEYGDITDMDSRDGTTWLLLNGRQVEAGYIFSSILPKLAPAKGEHMLLQHFKGWMIQTEQPVFQPAQATLMDFRVGQQHGTTFVYVMPFTPHRALVEYTLFSPALLQQQAYDDGLQQYMREHLHCDRYQVLETEFGIIPMTNHRFPVRRANIVYLGTAGGQTKASSGYTFRFIQKHSEAVLKAMLNDRLDEDLPTIPRKYHFYDSVLLNVLATGKATGATVFTDLFASNPPGRIFRFLNNDSSLAEDISLISTLPVWPFLKAGVREMC